VALGRAEGVVVGTILAAPSVTAAGLYLYSFRQGRSYPSHVRSNRTRHLGDFLAVSGLALAASVITVTMVSDGSTAPAPAWLIGPFSVLYVATRALVGLRGRQWSLVLASIIGMMLSGPLVGLLSWTITIGTKPSGVDIGVAAQSLIAIPILAPLLFWFTDAALTKGPKWITLRSQGAVFTAVAIAFVTSLKERGRSTSLVFGVLIFFCLLRLVLGTPG
jgi:hypothetical protein